MFEFPIPSTVLIFMVAPFRFIALNTFIFIAVFGFVAAFERCVPVTKHLVAPIGGPKEFVQSIFGTFDGETDEIGTTDGDEVTNGITPMMLIAMTMV